MNHLVESSKRSAVDGMAMFLRNFGHVPEDKLDWRPTPTAKSALQIAAHTALYAGRFAALLRARALPKVDDVAAWMRDRQAEEDAVTSRAEVIRIFESGTAEVLAALDTLSDEDVAVTLDSGQGWTMPMSFLMGLAGWHATLHTGQIDYVQTCYGDTEIYVG